MNFNRLQSAEQQLDRMHAFFPRIDAKMSALLAIATGEVAIFALNLSPNDLALWYVDVTGTLFAAAIVWVLAQLYFCAGPHLAGGNQSLIYFREIAKRTEANFIREYLEISEEELLRDVAAQVWRNSEIVSAKFDYLKKATTGLVLSLVPWAIALIATALTHHRLPIAG
jgi:hypothetical protein